jgi:hypothetical protein
MITQEQIEFFQQHGFLRLEQVYSPNELGLLSEDLNFIMQTFANWDAAWRGQWRKEYMDEQEDRKATLVAIHELQHYSAEWTRAMTKPDLADRYRIEDAVAVPAKSGDVILFHLWTIHGSSVNHSDRWRRLVRMGFRDPRNRQVGGQAFGRPGIMVKGARPKVESIEINVYGNWMPAPAASGREN